MKYLLLLLFPWVLQAQNPELTFKRLVQKFNQVKSYDVVATIKPQIPLIRILPVKANIHFSYPSNFQVQSAGISILPKNGFSELPLLFSKPDDFTAIASGMENSFEIITLLPKQNDSNIILAKIWVDASSLLVVKSQITSRSNGTITCEFDYNQEKTWGLPAHMKFVMDVNKFKIPKGLATDINRTSRPAETDAKSKKGTIDVYFNKYKVN
jgi:outer membrane lipoprotein-sorting protein